MRGREKIECEGDVGWGIRRGEDEIGGESARRLRRKRVRWDGGRGAKLAYLFPERFEVRRVTQGY